MVRLAQIFFDIEIIYHNTKMALDPQLRNGISLSVVCPFSSTLSIVGASVSDELVVLTSIFGLT